MRHKRVVQFAIPMNTFLPFQGPKWDKWFNDISKTVRESQTDWYWLRAWVFHVDSEEGPKWDDRGNLRNTYLFSEIDIVIKLESTLLARIPLYL